jgi:3-oxoacyl-[acyl-carrier protein] reductase
VSFAGQTVVVTGGTRGLGRAIALDFLEQGATVVSTWHKGEAAARAFEDEAGRFEGRARLARFDVADYAACQAFWEALESEHPDGVQVLVNNSGTRRDRVLAMMSSEEWREVLDTNLTGGFHMSRFAVLHMLPRRYGRILFITSPAGRQGFEGQANYSASKAGQVGLMRSLAREVARRGITVNCVSPGFCDTELLADLPEEVKKRHLESVPLKRFADPREVAYAVRCLAAREASYVTGATLEVTGGL